MHTWLAKILKNKSDKIGKNREQQELFLHTGNGRINWYNPFDNVW